MKTKLNILQLQDPATEAESIRNILTNDKLHFEITFADTKDKFIQALINSRFDVILHNDHVPFLTAVEALDILNEKNIKTPFILISSPQNDLFTAAIFKKGATDYISKKELFRITAAITAAIENNRNREPEILQLSKEGNGEVANEIQRQSARLIEALAVAKVGSWETDLQTFDIKWSEETHHIYETDPKEFTVSYENYLSFLHPDDSISVIAAFENSFNSETINSVEHRIIAANGIIKYVIENWKISRDPKGRPLVAIGTCQDITEKKSLEKAIENERDQFIDMFLNAPSAIGMLRGAEHVFEMVNPLYLQLTGKKDIIGKTVLEVFPEVVEQGFIGILDTVYTTGKPYIGTEVLMKVNKEGNGELTDSYANFIYQAYRNTEGNVEGIFFFINDITEQILSRKAIEKSEKFFKGVIENSDDMITMLDGTGKTIYASPAVSKKFGYTNAECLNLNINDVIHPDDVLKMQEFIMKLMMHPGVPMECPLVREMKKDGSYIWAEGTLTNFLETEGINAIVGNFRDVTEKKKLESLLNKSNRLARIGSWEFDVNSKSVFWSDITKEIREVGPDFIPHLDDGISHFKDGRHKEIIMERVQDCIDKGLAWDEELEITTHKGNNKWVRTIGEGEFVNGKCVKVYGSFQDINARKEAEREALKAYEEKNIILESIGDAFFAIDKHWVVTYWNNQAEKMLMLSKTEMVGAPLWDKFSHNTDAYKKYHRAVANKQVIHFEDYYKPLDKWYGISAYPSDNGLSVYFKDITEKKIAEQKLKDLNNELEESVKQLVLSNAELEQFAYVASHDLQEPLRMVTSFLLQIEKKYAGVLDDKGKRYIHFAMDGAKRMKQIILDLLEFSLVGQVDDKLETVDMNELLNEVLGLLRKKIEEKKAIIKIGRLPVLKTFKPPLLQVFQNLLSNSLKYHSKEDAVKIVVSVKENENNWEFSVSDNGIGIAPEYFDKIFTIFQRLHNKDEYSGTGIGLAISKKIIENMGGNIWVESEEGKGSTFYFTLLK